MNIQKKKKYILLMAVFSAVSILFITPRVRVMKSGVNSSQLRQVIKQSGDTERMDYVNEDGEVTVAADFGYATILVTRKENSRLEQFLDEQEEPVRRYSGEYAVLREYDDRGNIIRNTSLDAQGELMSNTSGYAVEERRYDENGQVVTIRYYDTNMAPVCTAASAYGKINRYDENGRIVSVTYIDDNGGVMMTGQGFAMARYSYYETDGPENGKTESELYFDADGNPVSLSLGQYGVHKEYDEYGREKVWTYLDEEGNPVITNKGFTTVVRTFQPNNYTATEQYYDLEGNPFSLADGQYGIKKERGRTLYLNENGEEQFNLKAFLNNHSRIVILLAWMAVLISILSGRKMNILFLVFYICAIVYLTLMFRDREGQGTNFQLFWSYRAMLKDGSARAEVLKNIWLFISLGTILFRVCPKRSVLLAPVMLSILIEVLQYWTGTGLCELDDILSNSLGGLIGYEAGRLLNEIKSSIMNMNRKKETV